MTDQNGELPIIEFVAPMPGFPEYGRFVLTQVDDGDLLFALRALDEPAGAPLPRIC